MSSICLYLFNLFACRLIYDVLVTIIATSSLLFVRLYCDMLRVAMSYHIDVYRFLQRHPKNLDLTKSDLLKLLSCLEGELQARDVSIAALKVVQSSPVIVCQFQVQSVCLLGSI